MRKRPSGVWLTSAAQRVSLPAQAKASASSSVTSSNSGFSWLTRSATPSQCSRSSLRAAERCDPNTWNPASVTITDGSCTETSVNSGAGGGSAPGGAASARPAPRAVPPAAVDSAAVAANRPRRETVPMLNSFVGRPGGPGLRQGGRGPSGHEGAAAAAMPGSGAGDAGGGDALDDLALEEQEHHDQRQRGEHRLGHVLRVLDAVGADHRLQTDREGHEVRVVDDDERPQEVVPRADEHEDR